MKFKANANCSGCKARVVRVVGSYGNMDFKPGEVETGYELHKDEFGAPRFTIVPTLELHVCDK